MEKGIKEVVGPGGNTPPLAVPEKIEELEQRIRKLESFVLLLREATFRESSEFDESDFV